MKMLQLLLVIVVMSLATSALARMGLAPTASVSEITPQWLNPEGTKDRPFVFAIHSGRMSDGSVKFSIRLTEQEMKFPQEWSTALANVHADAGGRDLGIRDLCPIRAKHEGDSITCVFTVPPDVLKDPEISFHFSVPVSGQRSSSQFYAPLKYFLPE